MPSVDLTLIHPLALISPDVKFKGFVSNLALKSTSGLTPTFFLPMVKHVLLLIKRKPQSIADSLWMALHNIYTE